MPDATRSQQPKLLDEVCKCCFVREGRCRKIRQKTTGQGKESSKKSPYGNWLLWRVIFIDNARVDESEEDG